MDLAEGQKRILFMQSRWRTCAVYCYMRSEKVDTMPRKHKRPSRQLRPLPMAPVPRDLSNGLAEVAGLMQQKQWADARTLLEALSHRYPNRLDILTDLVNANYELHDLRGYRNAGERLIMLDPHDADLALAMGGAYMETGYPMLALRAFRSYLERWPEHPRADDARRSEADLRSIVDQLLERSSLQDENALELTTLHEEARLRLETGDYQRGRQLAQMLLRRRPDFAPALNNLSLLAAAEGRLDEAIATAQRVLNSEPTNYHALANLVRFLCLSGRSDQASPWAERLKAVETDNSDVWLKQAEGLSFMGDDQGVLDAFHAAERHNRVKQPFDEALLYHFAAVATMRLGRTAEATRLWRRALKAAPGFNLAQANLDDLDRPVGEQHAPWPFTLNEWTTEKTRKEIMAQFSPPVPSGGEQVIARAMQRLLRKQPELTGLVPLLLNRGDPPGRELAFNLALTSNAPEMPAALRDFALGQRGPEQFRIKAAQVASRAGLIPQGAARLWIQGEWSEVMLMDFEINDEPLFRHSEQVAQLLIDGTRALRAGDSTAAEKYLKQALELEPEAPDLLNNLAIAYELQRRTVEAHDLVREIHARHPDYSFPRISLAQLAMRDGKLDEAKALLDPLLTRQRFHLTEYTQLCRAMVDLMLAQKNREGAQSWINMWASVNPDDPAIPAYRVRIGLAALKSPLSLLKGKRSKR